MTPTGIEPTKFRLLAQRHRVPRYRVRGPKNSE